MPGAKFDVAHVDRSKVGAIRDVRDVARCTNRAEFSSVGANGDVVYVAGDVADVTFDVAYINFGSSAAGICLLGAKFAVADIDRSNVGAIRDVRDVTRCTNRAEFKSVGPKR